MSLKSKIIVLVFVLILISCDEKRVFDKYIPITSTSWAKEKHINFPFEVKDTVVLNNLFINLRTNNSYGYSNLLLIAKLKFPDGKQIIDTLEYEMTDRRGKFLGKGFSEVKENKLFYKENIRFPLVGKYDFTVEQAMRKHGQIEGLKTLDGVTEVGFRIEK